MSNSKVKHYDRLSVIHADFDIWSGQTRLSGEDLKLGHGGEIPPSKVAQLGSKRICGPENLRGFHRLKTETRRLLLRHGMPFMNGVAVPVDKTDEICERLDQIEGEFNALKSEFIRGYHQAVEEWVDENPEYGDAIRRGALPIEEVERRIGFEYQVFMMKPLDNDSDEVRQDRLNKKIENLGQDIIDEVVQESSKFYAEKLAGRETCAVSTKKTLKKVRDKIYGLSFLNGNLVSLTNLLDQTLQGYAQFSGSREVTGPFFYQVVAAVLIMSSRDRIEQYSAGEISVDELSRETAEQTAERKELIDDINQRSSAGNVVEDESKPDAASEADTDEESDAEANANAETSSEDQAEPEEDSSNGDNDPLDDIDRYFDSIEQSPEEKEVEREPLEPEPVPAVQDEQNTESVPAHDNREQPEPAKDPNQKDEDMFF